MWVFVVGVGILFMAFAYGAKADGGEAAITASPVPKLPGSSEVSPPKVPTAHQSLDAVLLMRARLRATGSSAEEVAKLCDPIVVLLMREEVASEAK